MRRLRHGGHGGRFASQPRRRGAFVRFRLPYGYDPDDLPDSDYYGGFTLSDIKEAAGDLPCDIDDEGKAAPGVYVVGRDIDEGLYFLQGNPSTESECYLFDPEGFGTYNMDAAVTYTGNYFADLEDGQVVVFMPSSTSMLMIPADQADFQPQAPYASGLYRVGQDIPAGTYTITVSPAQRLAGLCRLRHEGPRLRRRFHHRLQALAARKHANHHRGRRRVA